MHCSHFPLALTSVLIQNVLIRAMESIQKCDVFPAFEIGS